MALRFVDSISRWMDAIMYIMPKKENISIIDLEQKLNDASVDRIFAIDTSWKIIGWNKSSPNIAEIKNEEVLGRNLFEVFPEMSQDEEMILAFRHAMEGKKSFLPPKSDIHNRTYCENYFIPLSDDSGNIIGVINLMHDVSRRIKIERSLQRLNSELNANYEKLERINAELATFTSIAGRELKDPIKKIYVTLELIIKTEGRILSDQSKAKFRRMQSSLNQISLLLDDILSLSSISSMSLEFSNVDLHKMLDNVLSALKNKIQEKNAIVEVDNLPTIHGSVQMLEYLFYNLIDNAIKFHSNGNQPRITISSCKKIGKSNRDFYEREYHCISVTDNGIGFHQKDTERIFLMFERLHAKKEFSGSGIGLAICQKIIGTHGGYIEVESHPGKGSSFHCYFPVHENEADDGKHTG